MCIMCVCLRVCVFACVCDARLAIGECVVIGIGMCVCAEIMVKYMEKRLFLWHDKWELLYMYRSLRHKLPRNLGKNYIVDFP